MKTCHLWLAVIIVLQACSTTQIPETAEARTIEDTADSRIDQGLSEPCRFGGEGYPGCVRCDEMMVAKLRVTELYIYNLQRRLTVLEDAAKCCTPYSSDPKAPMIEEPLLQDIRKLTETIKRHEANLEKLHSLCPKLPDLDGQLIAGFRRSQRLLMAGRSRSPGDTLNDCC